MTGEISAAEEDTGDIGLPGLGKYWFSEWRLVESGKFYTFTHNLGMLPKIVQIWFCAREEVDEQGNPLAGARIHPVTVEGRIDMHHHPQNEPDPAKNIPKTYNCVVYHVTDSNLQIFTEMQVGRGPISRDDWRKDGYYRVLLWA